MTELEHYIRDRLHRFKCPSWLKIRELDVLMCIVPGPLGLGMSYRQTARFLGINVSTVNRVTNGLQKNFPEAWERVQSMRRVMERQRIGIHGPRSIDGLVASIGYEGLNHLQADDNFELEE